MDCLFCVKFAFVCWLVYFRNHSHFCCSTSAILCFFLFFSVQELGTWLPYMDNVDWHMEEIEKFVED